MRMRSDGGLVETSEHAQGSDELELWKSVCAKHDVPMPYFKTGPKL